MRRGHAGAWLAGAWFAGAWFAGAIAVSPVQGEEAAKWGLRAAEAPVSESSGAQSPAAIEAASVTAIDIARTGEGRTRILLRLSRPVDPVSFLLADPDRAIIDLPDVTFAPAAGAANQTTARKSNVLVGQFRFGQLEAGKARIVLDLTAPARIAASRLETVEGVHRYALELESASRADFLAAVQPGQNRASATARAPDPRAEGDSRPLVALDPGHGGIDTGARGAAQAYEKEVVLAFARQLGAQLEASGRYRVLMTRSEDVFVSLPQRVKIARDAGAKLFISIHADTLNLSSVEGATVYTVSDKASDIHAARLAEKENAADKLAGAEANEDIGDVSDILFDLTRRETRTYSHFFARSLVAYWKDAGKLNKNPIRSAGFRVLMAPDVPSVLLELGYLSSRAEAAKLSQPEWQAQAAGSVVKSVDDFFEPRAAKTAPSGERDARLPQGPTTATASPAVAPAIQ